MIFRRYLLSRFYLAAFALFILSGCESDSSGPQTNNPVSTRGTVLSSKLIQSMPVGEITTELQRLSSFLSATNSVDVYRLTYETIDPAGQTTTASGTVILPKNMTVPVPIVSYQHGTVVRKSSVPLYTGYSYDFENLAGVGFGGNGYITVIPDYLGLGDGPGLHPYVHAPSLASAVIDMLRAAKSFSKSKGVQWNNQIFLCGYSEGGFATMAAQKEIEASHMKELPLIASAPMAGPYDMSGTMKELMLSSNPYIYPLFLPYIVYSYSRIYGEYELSEVFKPEYAASVPALFDGLHGFSEINIQLPEVPSEMFSQEFLIAFSDSTHPLRRRLHDNDLYRWSPKIPTRMYHCTGDEQVPYENSLVALENFTQRGSNVELNTPGPDMHDPCSQKSMIFAKFWFDSLKK